ncbi:MAG: hypothetical protein QXV37_02725 [Candidatus Jordarchaeaceae archaeon]
MPRIADERVPNKEELNRILKWLHLRAEFQSRFMAFSGLTPESIRNYNGSDGLKLRGF